MKADMILKNGVIASMDEEKNYYECLAVSNGLIIAAGKENDMENYMDSQTEIIDLAGKVVVPGLIDAHQHIFKTGLNLNRVNCKTTSIKEMVERCKQYSEEINDDSQWIIGWGYDESLYQENRHPVASDFEGINNPIYINHYSGHSAVANYKALELAGVTTDTEVDYGHVELDSNGKPDGRLIEHASDLVSECIPSTTEKQLRQALKTANDKYIQYGITSVHEAGMGLNTGSLDEFKLIQEAKKNDELKIRIYAMVMDEFYDDIETVNLASGFGNNDLKIGSIKVFADGTLSLETAAVTKPYKNSNGYGKKVHTIEDLQKFIYKAHKQGYQIACHAIGDDAVKDVLDAYEIALNDYPDDKRRHRIEHVSISDRSLLQRMKKLNIIPVPQPVFLYFAGDVYLENLHDSLADKIISTKTFLNEGLFPAGSSDSPVQDPSPFLGIYAAMSRKTIKGNIISEEEKISLYEALKLYTINAAKASCEEDIKGTIEEGKLADLTVLPEDFLNYSAAEVKDSEVEITIIDGEVVYRKS